MSVKLLKPPMLVIKLCLQQMPVTFYGDDRFDFFVFAFVVNLSTFSRRSIQKKAKNS